MAYDSGTQFQFKFSTLQPIPRAQVRVIVCTCLWTLQLEVSRRLLSLIRLQRWVCSLSPLSPTCLPLPLILSPSLFSPAMSLPLFGYRGLKFASSRPLPLAPLQTNSLSLVYIPSLSYFLSLLCPSPDSSWQGAALQLVHTRCRRLGAIWLSPLTYSWSCAAKNWPSITPI